MAQEEIIFKVGVDTGDSVQDVNKVGDAIENVGKDAKKTDGSFVNLRKELKQLTVQLQNLDPASKEFEQVAKRAGQIKEQMRGVADAINDADPEKFGGKFQRTAEGIAGAFSAVTGAQALFGQQSEEIEKQMLKVQGAIALTQGISAMKELKNDATELGMSIKNTVVNAFKSLTTAEMINAAETGSLTLLQKGYAIAVGTSTGAMKAFRIALAATGIGLVVVALGFLVEKMISYMSSTDSATKAQDRLTASTKRFNDERERMNKKLNDSIEYEKNYAKAVGASEEKIYEIEKEGFKKREMQRESDYWANLQRIETLKNKKKGALDSENMDLVKSINEEITTLKTKNNDLIALKYQLQRDEKVLTAQHNTDLKNEQKKASDESIKKNTETAEKNAQIKAQEDAEILALKRKITDLTIANIEDEALREQEALKEKQKREKEDLQKHYADKKVAKEDFDKLMLELDKNSAIETAKLTEEQNKVKSEKEKEAQNKKFEDQKAFIEADLIRAEEDFNLKQQKRIELENKDFEQQIANTELTDGQRELLKAQHEANLVAIAKDSADRQKEIDEATKQSKMELMNAVGSIFGELAGLSKQASGVQKAFAITQVAIDTATALSGLTSISFSPTNGDNSFNPLGPYIKLATGTAKIISNMARVKSILGSGVSVAPPTTGGRPNANLGIGATQGAQQTVQAQSTYKVVVVDSDITKMQDKTKKVNAISTI
ncbi:hypothetical protein UFOVP603_12 [uncultured Caudovirales phage]|uniref:Uncharacterized protein n=1 Tax=uncultured Caudovirales phage TaxID=2100421 RepID=A0A6J5N2E2_9CAUD|nr:hypothetical protein UFOVP603_12 [uncultured Caudovirales phage]